MPKEILLCRNNEEKDDRTTSATRQAGFWWLVERKLVNLKGSSSWTIFRKHPACV